ncbi:hypothetical protein [Nocardia blacklockiae]|uniref:hypothetical protein n=1 Tax=Nocardia blacklockiae TaxID=480036 RepID=UPI0018961B16|nr:hypothetical protein [Nocardia blacklockiae]MBF6173373.1 hypothetical protein [Nocardia blacklockiae]
MASPIDPGEVTFTLPRAPRLLRELVEDASVPVGDPVQRGWGWVNLDWIGVVVGLAPL